MATPERKVTRFGLLRAAATPLLVLGLLIGTRVAMFAGAMLIDTLTKPSEGHFAGFAAFGVGIVAFAGLATAINCAVGLWLFWRKWKPKAIA